MGLLVVCCHPYDNREKYELSVLKTKKIYIYIVDTCKYSAVYGNRCNLNRENIIKKKKINYDVEGHAHMGYITAYRNAHPSQSYNQLQWVAFWDSKGHNESMRGT